jgi:hypothetical protein
VHSRESANSGQIELVDLAGVPNSFSDPARSLYAYFDGLRERSPVVRVQSAGEAWYSFLRAATAKRILTDTDTFRTFHPDAAASGYFDDEMLPASKDPPEHQQYRKLIQGTFSPGPSRHSSHACVRTRATWLRSCNRRAHANSSLRLPSRIQHESSSISCGSRRPASTSCYGMNAPSGRWRTRTLTATHAARRWKGCGATYAARSSACATAPTTRCSRRCVEAALATGRSAMTR